MSGAGSLPAITVDGRPVVTGPPNDVGTPDELLPILEQNLNETAQVMKVFTATSDALFNRQSQYLIKYRDAVNAERQLNRATMEQLTLENRRLTVQNGELTIDNGRLTEEKDTFERQLNVATERVETANDGLEMMRKTKEDNETEHMNNHKRTYDNMRHIHKVCEDAHDLVSNLSLIHI